MYELETVRTWERNPQMYADALGTSLAGQALFAYAPEAERARRVVSKLRQVPRLVQAARDNIKECPGIFVKIGLETWRGVAEVHRDRSAARVLDARRPAHPRRPRRHVHRGGGRDRRRTSTTSKPTSRRAPRRRSGSGASSFEQKLKLEEGITLSADRLLAIALRELHEVQEEFRIGRRAAQRRRSRSRRGARPRKQHPGAGHSSSRPRRRRSRSSRSSCSGRRS